MLEVSVLSVLQGIAEFLPISSSGHLVLGKSLLGLGDVGMRLDIFLHVGTLLSIFVFYFSVIRRIFTRLEWSYMAKVVVSAVPAGVVGVCLKDDIEAAFSSTKMVGAALMFTGLVLAATRFLPKGTKDVSFLRALLMGVAQAVAILPGVSRSGMTLAAARASKVDAEKAAEFSFLMSAPPIGGAALLEILKTVKGSEANAAAEASWGLCIFGALLAAVVGWFALRLLVASLKGRWFWLFGPYCLVAGLVVLFCSSCTAAERTFAAVHPQSFQGGWKLDCQFMDVIGSPCLIAHGMGRPVPDSRAVVELPEPGRWRIAVRAKNWLPEDCQYPVTAADYPGTFRVLVDGRAVGKAFGRGPKAWAWEDGGDVECPSRRVTVTLRDEDGFDGRCAGIVFYRGEFPLAGDAALDVRAEPVSERSAYDLVVVGGGVPGCCAAVAAARAGIRVALVQDRPVLGGNSSSEIRVWSAGEQRHPIVKEMRSLFMNRDPDNAVSDATRLAKLEREPNVSVFLSHRVFGVEKEGAAIRAAKAVDLARNRVVAFEGRYFVDATGDGWLGYYAGADYRQGREARGEFNESFAPEKADGGTLGASLMWNSSEANDDVPFSAPWAEPYACGKSVVNGEWNWEYGLDRDVIAEGEQVRDRLLLAIFGAFSNAKRDSANSRRVLTTLPFLLGKRESRRLMGDWLYKQQDVENRVQFEDAIATGSWSVDLHYVIDPKVPFITRCEQPHFGRYWIPYRSIYSRNIENLFVVGRCFSCTHVGLGGPRVINTLSQLAVAAGTAAAMCCEKGETPRQIYTHGRVRELQRRLGGDWPGNPGPERRGWRVVDDEDPCVKFVGKWSRAFQCNGGQEGNYASSIRRDAAAGASAAYPLPVERAGRYALKGNTPWCWGLAQYGLGEVHVDVVSGAHTNSLVWNQAAGNGGWVDLGSFDLEPGAVLLVQPEKSSAGAVYADGFALVP